MYSKNEILKVIVTQVRLMYLSFIYKLYFFLLREFWVIICIVHGIRCVIVNKIQKLFVQESEICFCLPFSLQDRITFSQPNIYIVI